MTAAKAQYSNEYNCARSAHLNVPIEYNCARSAHLIVLIEYNGL